ncbi:hypothetical protein DFJ77DRAFT_443664 [Powellomyces hirtus]|nr:hypothetical protein DFJ77DRAFT_443664 [Powellomyces hirtus]
MVWLAANSAVYTLLEERIEGIYDPKDLARHLLICRDHVAWDFDKKQRGNGVAFSQLQSFCESSNFKLLGKLVQKLDVISSRGKMAVEVIAHEQATSGLVNDTLDPSETSSGEFVAYSLSYTINDDDRELSKEYWESRTSNMEDLRNHPDLEANSATWVESQAFISSKFTMPPADPYATEEQMNTTKKQAKNWQQWKLSTGKDGGKTIECARASILVKDRASNLLWSGIIDVSESNSCLKSHFTDDKIREMLKDFEEDGFLCNAKHECQTKIIRVLNAIEGIVKTHSDPNECIDAIKKLQFEGNRECIDMRRVIQQYAWNVKRMPSTSSEAAMDNATLMFLVKELVDHHRNRWQLEESKLQSLGSQKVRNGDFAKGGNSKTESLARMIDEGSGVFHNKNSLKISISKNKPIPCESNGQLLNWNPTYERAQTGFAIKGGALANAEIRCTTFDFFGGVIGIHAGARGAVENYVHGV